MKIILASKSPRRKEILQKIAPEFEVIVSNADETLTDGLSVKEQLEELSYVKAKKVFDETTGNRIVIASDTIVFKNGKYYGKAKSIEHAKEMINIFKSTFNDLITGVCILIEEDGKYTQYKDCEQTRVYISDLTDKEIEEWINSGEAMDKAGAYAIQGKFSKFINKIEGNYESALGLPLNKVYQYIKKYI